MAEFGTVETVADFRTLDEGEVLEGYLDGFEAAGVPDSSRSRSYWHGWRNGVIESKRMPPDAAYCRLAGAFEAVPPAALSQDVAAGGRKSGTRSASERGYGSQLDGRVGRSYGD